MKRDSSISAFIRISQKFWGHLFCWTQQTAFFRSSRLDYCFLIVINELIRESCCFIFINYTPNHLKLNPSFLFSIRLLENTSLIQRYTNAENLFLSYFSIFSLSIYYNFFRITWEILIHLRHWDQNNQKAASQFIPTPTPTY